MNIFSNRLDWLSICHILVISVDNIFTFVHKCSICKLVFSPILQSSNESMADEDSEDTHSRADSRTNSRSDLQEASDAPTLNTSKHSITSETDTEPLRSYNNTPPGTPKSSLQKVHKFLYKTFSVPYKCNHCTSLLVGVHRQGITCDGNSDFHYSFT